MKGTVRGLVPHASSFVRACARLATASVLAFSIAAVAAVGNITTFAGGAVPAPSIPPSGVSATSVKLGNPSAVVVDSAGAYYFNSSLGEGSSRFSSIHKVAGGIITTVHPNVGEIWSMAIDGAGNLYVCDYITHQVRKIDTAGVMTVVAGTGTAGFGGDNGPAASAMLNAPRGIAVDGNALLVADTGNGRVRRISGGTITTVAGNGEPGGGGDGGPALQAQLSSPGGIVSDGAGGFYVLHSPGPAPNFGPPGALRRVNAAGTISLVGPVPIYLPAQITRDSSGNVYVAGFSLVNKVFKVSAGGSVESIAGNGGFGYAGDGASATGATLGSPPGVAVSATGEVFIADSGNERIRKVDLAGVITTVAGGGTIQPSPTTIGDGGPATQALLTRPLAVSFGPSGRIQITEVNRIRSVDSSGTITTLAGTGTAGNTGDGGPAASAQLSDPRGAFTAPGGAPTYILDSGNNAVRGIDSAGVINSVWGLPSTQAGAMDPTGRLHYIGFDRVVRLSTVVGQLPDIVAGNGSTTHGGDGGPATAAGMLPRAITFDAAGNLYIATLGSGPFSDPDGYVRKVDTAGVISTVAGGGAGGDGGPATSARLVMPTGLAVDSSGNLYISESPDNFYNNMPFGNRIRMVSPDGNIQTIAGTGLGGYSGDGGPAVSASFSQPYALAWNEAASALFVADRANNRVRRIEITDTTPAAFSFAAQTGVAPSAVVQSATVTPTAYVAAAPVSIAGGEYSIGCSASFTSAAGSINPGQSVCVRHTAPSLNNITTTTALTIGGVKASFASTTATSAGTLVVSPQSLDFGVGAPNTTSAAKPVTLTNAGATPIAVHSISTAAPFTVTHDCTTLAPAAVCTAQVRYSPTQLGTHDGSLAIVAATGSHAVALSAKAEVVNQAGITAVVTHYYQAILRRAPDPGGAEFWVAEAVRVAGLRASASEALYSMAMQFFASAEYLARNADDTAYVTDLYNAFFQRPPDAGGLAHWKSQLAQGMPREVLLVSFLFSSEFTSFAQATVGSVPARAEVDVLMDIFRGVFARLPDSNGFTFFVGQLRAAQCLGQAAVTSRVDTISQDAFASTEYAARGRTNAQYVGDLYNAFMRRGGELAGVLFWINQLASGAQTREQVRVQFRNSLEFQARVTAVISQGCLQ